jgi:hypothetical protein
MEREFEKKFKAFETDLETASSKLLDKDNYGGSRFLLKTVCNGVEVPLKLPPSFFKFAKVNIEDGYVYLFPEDQDDVDYGYFRKAIQALEDKVKSSVDAKKYTPLIKTDKRSGISVKFYGKQSNITSRFADSSGQIIEIDDDRLHSQNYSKVMFPIINMDSVYVTNQGQASIQLKLVECVCFFNKMESHLDIELIGKLRAMKVSR